MKDEQSDSVVVGNCESEPMLKLDMCCLCGARIGSEFLAQVFPCNPRVYYLAVMVGHYRHNHVKYYDNGVGYASRYHDYGTFKSLVNERAKRQIVRKAKQFLIDHGFTPKDFEDLPGTDPTTLALAKKLLIAGRDEITVAGE